MSTLAARLRGVLQEPRRLQELGFAFLFALVAFYLSLSVPDRYPAMFGGLLSLVVVVLMVANQERTLYLLLFFSTIYMLLKSTLFAWSSYAFLVKEGFLMLLVGFWLFHLLLRQERIPKTPVNEPLAYFVVWLLLQCFNPSTFGFLAITDDLRQWLGPIAVFYLTIHLVNTRQKLERGLRFVFGYAVFEMVYGISQQFQPASWLIRMGANPESYFYFLHGTVRSFSTMGTVGFALFASMFPTIAFFYMSQQRNVVHRWLCLLLGVGFVVAVVFTLVRTGWVACSLTVIAYAIATRRFELLLVLALVAAVVITGASGYMRWKVEGLMNPEEDASVQARMTIVQNLSRGVAFRFFGYGLGTFAQNRFAQQEENKPGYGVATENWYLTASLQLGWVGVALLVWIWVKLYGFAWRGYRGALKTRRYRELAMGLAGSLFAIEVARLGGPAGYYPPDSWHYWFFAGLLMTLPRADEELHRELTSSQAASGAGGSEAVALAGR